MLTTDELIARLDTQHAEVTTHHRQMTDRVEEVRARLLDVEQKVVRGNGGSFTALGKESLGSVVANSELLRDFAASGFRGSVRIPVQAALTTTGLAPVPDRQTDLNMQPRQRLTVRDLLAPGRTSSNLVQFTRQTGRTNNADVVSEGAEKPESSIAFELAETPVRTIATWIPISRQVADDVPLLQSTIDTELRYMIGLAEEDQILYGDGDSPNIEGLSTQVTAYAAPFAVENATMLDVILLAIAQAQQSHIMATGVILNDLDWAKMQAIKNDQGDYIGGGPFASIGSQVWTLPVVATPAILAGKFMVGAFAIAAQIIDRMTTEVLISSEDRDNFIKNMLTVRAEERVALAVKIPEAIVYGEYDQTSG